MGIGSYKVVLLDVDAFLMRQLTRAFLAQGLGTTFTGEDFAGDVLDAFGHPPVVRR